MGRQVNFYMLPDDIAAYEQVLKAEGNVCFLEEMTPTPQIRIIDTLAVPETKNRRLRVYLAQEGDLSGIVTEEVPTQQYWLIDVVQSLAVEFDRSYYNGQILGRGRLYFQTGYYDSNDQCIDKPEEFVRWADRLLRWIRRHYKRNPETGFYLGPHAWEWVARGGQLRN